MISQHAATSITTSTSARTGQITATVDKTKATIASIVASTGLPTPAVVADETARSFVVASCVDIATPPPAMIASVQRQNGSTSVMASAATHIPAMLAAGTAM